MLSIFKRNLKLRKKNYFVLVNAKIIFHLLWWVLILKFKFLKFQKLWFKILCSIVNIKLSTFSLSKIVENLNFCVPNRFFDHCGIWCYCKIHVVKWTLNKFLCEWCRFLTQIFVWMMLISSTIFVIWRYYIVGWIGRDFFLVFRVSGALKIRF
jgi:hypothetical protein